MRIMKEEGKIEKLCAGFSLLDEKEQEYLFGILQALLFAKKKTELAIANASLPKNEAEKKT